MKNSLKRLLCALMALMLLCACAETTLEDYEKNMQVYYGEGEGVYHMSADCGTALEGAVQHSVFEALAAEMLPCPDCMAPDAEALLAAYNVMYLRFNPPPVVKPEIAKAADAPVYYTNGGTYCHQTSNCSGMMNAVKHTLSEAKTAGKKECPNCEVPSYSFIDRDVDYMWVDDKNVAHTGFDCEEFSGKRYSLLTFAELSERSYTYCINCGSDLYFDDVEASAAEVEEDKQLLYELEKSIDVYYGDLSRYYHADTSCQQMTDARYKHSLYEAIELDNKQPCSVCNPMTAEQAAKQLEQR